MSPRTYEQPCPDCGGYLAELGDSARCISCEAIHHPCWDDGCLGFLETNGWRGGVAILGCDTCDERFELPDRFAPTDASDSDTMVA